MVSYHPGSIQLVQLTSKTFSQSDFSQSDVQWNNGVEYSYDAEDSGIKHKPIANHNCQLPQHHSASAASGSSAMWRPPRRRSRPAWTDSDGHAALTTFPRPSGGTAGIDRSAPVTNSPRRRDSKVGSAADGEISAFLSAPEQTSWFCV